MSFSDWSNKKKKKTFSEWSNEKNGITEEDIAPTVSTKPTTSTKKDEDQPWYKSGVFEDGYQFGDVSKHILGLVSGTTEDVAPYVVGTNKEKKEETVNNATTQKEDSSYIMNYKPGVDIATRKSIYDSNAKRIAEIDNQLSQNASGKTSFWQSTNPVEWVMDKLSDSTKSLEEERKKLVEANAQYDKYGNAVDLSYDELMAKRDAAKDNADKLYYLSLANQKKLSDNAELMAKTKMDGTNHSVYEELQQIASMEDGEEKEIRKATAIKKMESLGVNAADYAMYSDDDNFSWATFFDWLGKSAMSGLSSFNKGITSTLDATAGSILKGVGWENNPISSMAQYYSNSYDNYKFDANLLAEQLGGGKGYEYAGAAIEGTVGAVPNAMLALMTQGASLGTAATTTTGALSTKFAFESGNILTKAGLTASAMAKNPQYWVSFAQTYGTDYEEAKEKGADDFTAALGATLSSLINAGIEIGIDGGSGIQGLPKDIAEGGRHAIWDWVESSLEEGGEEVVQGVVSNAVSKLLYDSDTEIANPEEMLKEFGLGTLSGLALGGGQIAVQSGTNAITNAIQEHNAKKLTETEQKVFDKVYEDRVAEESESGEVSNKRKKEIREEILNEMEKGYISTDTIEEVLAGDSYKAFKDNEANEEAIRKEYETLYNMKNGDKSSAQVDREAELKKMLEEIDSGTTSADLRSKLDDEVYGLVNGNRLSNSYIDRDNRRKAYEDDVTKYENKNAQTTIQNAIKSGVVNNSNRAHEMTETLTKLSADKNVVYDFVNDKAIEAQGRKKKVKATRTFTADGTTTEFSLDTKRMDSSVKPVVKVGNTVVDNYTVDYETGKIVFDSAPQKGKISVDYGAFGRINGWIETLEDGTKKITLNMDSNEVWQFTTGHEITHSLEGTKKYSKLREVLYQYAKDIGEYDSLVESVHDRYEEGTDYDSEQVADMVGRYLFQDEDFVKHLSVNHRNVFQWLWDEVKHLSKMVTAGSKEARQLEKVKRAFEEAYRAGGKTNNGVKYSFGVSQGDIDTYVDAAYKKENTEDYKKYAEVSDRLLNDVADEIDLSGYAHALRDNDIRHIRNSHGENTVEKYPVTKEDIKNIPWIVENYDKAVVVKRKDGKIGIIYVKTAQDGLVYYLEQVTSVYGNEPLLINKQMIKTGIDDIPDLLGLKDAITKKQSETEFLDDLKKAPKVYVQDVHQYHSINSISNAEDSVNTKFSTSNNNIKDISTGNASGIADEIRASEQSSISFGDKAPVRYGNFATPTSEVRYDAPTQEAATDVAPVQATVSNSEKVENVESVAPVQAELQDEYNGLLREKADLERRIVEAATDGNGNEAQLAAEYKALTERIEQIEADESAMQRDRFDSLTDEDAPPEMEAPYVEPTKPATPNDPFEDRDIKEVGNRKVKAYMYENPEVKPFFQDEARGMLGDLHSTIKGERWYNDKLYAQSNGELGWGGTKRHTTEDIAYLLDEFGYTYAQIEKGLNAIIEDNGAENNAVSKRIEFMLDERLRKGYTGVFGEPIPANQEYINLLNEKQIKEYSEDALQYFMEHADEYAPLYTEENIGQDVAQSIAPDVNENAHPVQEAPIKEEAVEDSTDPIPPEQKEKIARIRKANPKAAEGSWWTRTKKKLNNVVTILGDKGWAIENLSKKSGNRDLEAKYDFMKNRSGGVAQEYIHDNLLPILDRIEESGKNNPSSPILEVDGSTISDYMEQLDYYTKHLHNIDRMSLDTEEDKARRQEIRSQLEGYTENQIQSIASEKITRNTPSDRVETIYLAREYIDLGGEKGKNKPVFGYSVTADVSRKQVEKYESVHPEFIELAQEVNAYFKELRQFAVNQGLIKQTVADKWQGMYPHYVATSRTDRQGASVSVPLDSNKTGVNNPFKRATGGNGDFEPLAETMAKNTIQIFRAVHRNGFGLELQNTLENLYGSETTKTVDDSDIDVSDILEATQENDGSVLQAGKNGKPPQFTVFVKGKRVTFDITEDIYNALKPVEGELAKTHAIPNKIAEGYKKVLTELDPFFALVRNPIKDTKDVLFNSRHAFSTYSTAPKTMKEIASKGKYFTEYIKNGGKTTSYYDTKKQTFDRVDGGKWYGFPWRKYKQASENVEMFWRLSEYIASREAGESIEVAMLDSARVTTNFGAGADLTKWANRNGAMFLNPSVQGVMQNVRNVREAYHQGVKGTAILAAKVIATGLGGMFFNWLLWHDDEEYEELSEYVKQNYFCIWKTPDGKFIRIPKGRMEAVIQNGFEQMGNLITGNDDVDIETFLSLVKNNIAPNNPFENNLISPISQATSNTAWYGEELVPARLQNLPAAEQFDESTDEISKWLGKTFNISPYKVNYVLSQYGGGFADLVLPMLTNEAEGSSFFAPIADEFISDPLLKNQNVSDFYDKKDELTVNANSSKATEKDVLMSKYMNSINSELSELYKQKREIQNSSLSDAEKYEQVREIQTQIVSLAKEGIENIGNVNVDGKYATVGDRQYRWYEPSKDSKSEPGWQKITDDQLKKQQEVTEGLGITPGEYWSNKAEYDMKYYYPDKYDVLKEQGVSVSDYKENYEESAFIYTDDYSWAADNPEKYTLSKAVASDLAEYRRYTGELYDIKADKDENGKSITGSRKDKVIDYVNNLDIDYGARLILFKSEYPSDDTYNYDIINYLEENDAIDGEEMRTILTELGFSVSDDGTITWD